MFILIGLVIAGATAIALVFYGILFLAAYIGAQIVTRTHVKPYSDTPQRWGLTPIAVSFPSRDKILLSGWYFLVEQPRATVLLLHGFGGKPAGDGHGGKARILPWIDFFVRQNCSVFTFDFRGQGHSQRAQITFGKDEVRDVQGAVAFLKTIREFRESHVPLVLVGVSFGAAVALRAAPKMRDVYAVMAISPYADLALLIKELARRRFAGRIPGVVPVFLFALRCAAGVNLVELGPARSVSRISPRSVAILSGTADNIVPVSHVTLLSNAAGDPKFIGIITGAAHGLIFEDAPQIPASFARRAAEEALERILRPLPDDYKI